MNAITTLSYIGKEKKNPQKPKTVHQTRGTVMYLSFCALCRYLGRIGTIGCRFTLTCQVMNRVCIRRAVLPASAPPPYSMRGRILILYNQAVQSKLKMKWGNKMNKTGKKKKWPKKKNKTTRSVLFWRGEEENIFAVLFLFFTQLQAVAVVAKLEKHSL